MLPALLPEIRQLLAAVDHTLLSPTATEEGVRILCDEALEYGVASVCIPPSYVSMAVAYLQGRCPVCTVIGFPTGYQTTASKVFKAEAALQNGAHEIDMVVNIGAVKDQRYDQVLSDIQAVRKTSAGKILKVIVETCVLSQAEKIILCQIVTQSGADFIKTSTGFGSAGANIADVYLFREHIGQHVQIKASGGISTLEEAHAFLHAGAARLGSSRIVKCIQTQQDLADLN